MQLYERRMKYVKTEDERKKFADIDESYMTEESSSESESVNRHQHQWRSDGKTIPVMITLKTLYFLQKELNKFVKKLDKRADKEEKKTPNYARTALKKRVNSTPSLSGPPQNAPDWAVAGPPSINGTPSNGVSEASYERPESQETPEAPPGITANPRRLLGQQVFQDLYGASSSSSDSESDTD